MNILSSFTQPHVLTCINIISEYILPTDYLRLSLMLDTVEERKFDKKKDVFIIWNKMNINW